MRGVGIYPAGQLHRQVSVRQARGADHDCRKARRQNHQHRLDVLLVWTAQRGQLCHQKTGLVGLPRTFAVELSQHDIQVNAVLPRWYSNDMTGRLQNTPVADYVLRKTPAGRWGNPLDLAGVAILLASATSDFITGAAIPVDGGYSVADCL